MKLYSRIAVALIAAASLCTPVVAGETYVVDNNHSDATFRVRHLVSRVTGRFNDIAGEVVIDREDPSKSSVAFSIKTASIDTANERRDSHLQSADSFDVDNHSEITFKSTSVTKKGEGQFEVEGELTMRGVSKTVVLPVEFLGFALDNRGNNKAGFSTRTRLNRKDFGIIWNSTLDSGGFVLGDEVDIEINLELNKKKDEEEEAQS